MKNRFRRDTASAALALMLAGCIPAYTVSFRTDGEAMEPVTVKSGSLLGEIPDPAREGYDFTGWYRDAGCTAVWTGEEAVTESFSLYACWKAQRRTVHFETFGGTQIPDITVDYGTSVSPESLIIVKKGMELTGWYLDEELSRPYDSSQPVTEDITLYAGWEGNEHIELDVVTYINQAEAGALEGCEGASLLMGLQITGHAMEYDYYSFLDEMPYSPDSSPYKGFAGSLWADTPEIDAMMPGPVTEWGSRYGTTVDHTGCDTDTLISCLRKGHPVVVWTSIHMVPSQLISYEWGTYKSNNHVMLLIGYDQESNMFKLVDPAGWNGGIYWVSYDQFMASWECYQGAVEVY